MVEGKLFQKICFCKLKSHDNNFTNQKYSSEHHLSHASALPISFSKAIVLTADGVGEWVPTVAIGDGENLSTKRNTFSLFIGTIIFSIYLLHRI